MLTATTPTTRNHSRILYVDDEKLSLKYFQEIVGEDFNVITAPSAEEGLKVVEQDAGTIGIVVSDQRLGGMQGTDFLSVLRERHPNIIRILATAFSDISTAVSAINNGAIYHYISKPWDPNALLPTLRSAMEGFLLRAEREQLLREKALMVRELIVSDRLAGYGVLAEGINHHLRNALVPVEIYLQLAGESADAPDGAAADPAFLEELRVSARSQVRRITDMIGRLSSIRKIGSTRQDEPISVAELWREVHAQLAGPLEEKQIAFSLSADGILPHVESNRNRLNQVLRLVLDDALERLDPDGEIQVALHHNPGNDQVAGHIRMEITDNGPNVDTERLPSLFTPFFVRPENPKYVGINLATCYVTLCSLGGWASAFNDSSRGTVLALSLPLEPVERPSNNPPLETWERVLGPSNTPQMTFPCR